MNAFFKPPKLTDFLFCTVYGLKLKKTAIYQFCFYSIVKVTAFCNVFQRFYNTLRC